MSRHARILPFPYAESLSSARLDALSEENHGRRRDLVVDYGQLHLLAPAELFEKDGRPHERIMGRYLSRRLRFVGVRSLKRTGLYTRLESLPLDHAARSLRGAIHWRPPGQDAIYLFMNGSEEPATLLFSARGCEVEDGRGPAEPDGSPKGALRIVRDWSPPPPLPARIVPEPRQLYRRYGGDPVAIHLGARRCSRHLFVGGLDCQTDQRPAVEAVLNLSEEPSRWAGRGPHPAADRWAAKGEGRRGMNVAQIATEARWVIERLRAGQRVLVHCSAGMNRSATVCCAVLILLEAMTAEAALARVHEHHPWARPDSYHWLALRWLAYTSEAVRSG